MSIVTGRGDEGETDLMYGRRVAKSDPRVACYGAIDELNACLGLARCACVSTAVLEVLPLLQRELVEIMGEIATHPDDRERYESDGKTLCSGDRVETFTVRTREHEAKLPPREGGWAYPGDEGSAGSAHLDLARTIARRAERHLAGLVEKGTEPNQHLLVWLNRLSDHLWVLARLEESGTSPS